MLTTLVLEFDGEDTASAGVETMASTSAAGGQVAMEEVEPDLDDLNYTAQRAEVMTVAADAVYYPAIEGTPAA